MFRVSPGKVRRNFSAVQTYWRCTRSGANSSPAKFPANREKYREFSKFCSRKCNHLSLSYTLCWSNRHDHPKSEQGPIRELIGANQGLIREGQGIYCRTDFAARGFSGKPNC